MNDFRIVFIHGYTSSHLADWYPDISAELNRLGIDFAIPDLPGGTQPHANEWLEVLHQEVTKSNKPLVFVGHSLGTRTALMYLEKYKPQNVHLVMMIAAFANRLDNAIRSDGDTYPDFFEHIINMQEIKKLSDKFVVIHSKDDSGIPYEQGVEIANDLNAELITYENRDHFSKADNAPFVLQELIKELNTCLDFKIKTV